MNPETLNSYALAFVALLATLLYVALASGLRDLLSRRPNGFARVKRRKVPGVARDSRKVNKTSKSGKQEFWRNR